MINPERKKILDAARKARGRTSGVINVNSVPNEDRKLGQVASRKNSIRWFCCSCVGYNSDGLGSIKENIRLCEAYHCPLWPWRLGEIDMNATTTGGFGDD